MPRGGSSPRTSSRSCRRHRAAKIKRSLIRPQLNYRLHDFPLDSLAAWWPEDFAWQGRLNGELQLELPAAGPRGQIRLDAGNGVLRLREKGRWQDFPYRQLLLDGRLQPQRIDARCFKGCFRARNHCRRSFRRSRN